MSEEILMFIRGLITIAILIPISTLILMLTTRIFKVANRSFKTAFIVALIPDVVGFVLDALNRIFITTESSSLFNATDWVITIFLGILSLFLVKLFYEVKWGKSVLVWLVWLVIMMFIGIIVNLLLYFVFVLIWKLK